MRHKACLVRTLSGWPCVRDARVIMGGLRERLVDGRRFILMKLALASCEGTWLPGLTKFLCWHAMKMRRVQKWYLAHGYVGLGCTPLGLAAGQSIWQGMGL